MRQGYVKVAAVTPKVQVADTEFNGQQIRTLMKETTEQGAKIVVFPELCITGYSCGDLFLQEKLLQEARKELFAIAEESALYDGIFFVGLPFEVQGKLYNMAAAVSGGEILGLIPKCYLPNYNEFYEVRHFTSGLGLCTEEILENGSLVPVCTDLLFYCRNMPRLKIGVEICEDLWAPNPPSVSHALAGASLMVNLSASDEVTGKDIYRRDLVAGQSARLLCGYVYASAGDGESTQDVVYSGHNIISENGAILAESKRFTNEIIYSEIDIEKLIGERRRMSTFSVQENHVEIPFSLKEEETTLTRFVDPAPFVPGREDQRRKRCEEIFMIQAMGLKKRLEHTHSQSAVVGISGGLDSTLALLVVVKAFDLIGKDHKDIVAVTMPGFGTTDRTYENALNLIKSLGAELMEVSIRESVMQHFKDIGHDENVHDITYENSQARERTQILMDVANQKNGMVIGTGDMSELALGWATYNGDHMSMYGVNASVPKTLVRHLVRYYADTCGDEKLSATLYDVLDTPVSPELLPPKDGQISQKTEDLVGPYELHDFFMYYVLRFGFAPAKIYRLAKIAFAGTYDNEFILKWLKTFYRRFFAQQFKRSCLPDGPKVGTVAVSPRGDLRMPSDACATIWMKEVENLSV
ncbi:MAG: NAD(+) synthase [Agathobacter sp.]|nr:NAD(+) synthase [Agathobacter sp.]MBQ2283631.1 NAD(+) synthase [Agathobacter sp.]